MEVDRLHIEKPPRTITSQALSWNLQDTRRRPYNTLKRDLEKERSNIFTNWKEFEILAQKRRS
jgi:hypothetical protein